MAFTHLWWCIDGVLAGMPIPYVDLERRMNHGGAVDAYSDELPVLAETGIKAIISLLNLPTDATVFESAGFRFGCWPIPDGQPPTFEQMADITDFINRCRSEQMPVAVFCEAGLGRTGTILAGYLIHNGMSATEAIKSVREKEPSAVETVAQIQFLEALELSLHT